MNTACAPVLEFLSRARLIAQHETPAVVPLPGGVSSDIWRVELAGGPVCVKRALPQLRVAQRWEAPIERNAYEWQWMQAACDVIPGVAPRVLAHDTAGLFAMEYLDPGRHPLWKDQLRAGRADPGFAAEVGARLVRLHAASARRADIAARFATDASFHAIRIEPYLLATARAHPELAPALESLARHTAATRLALVHGDISPKNILAGPDGPVFLDAECAWFGDPAFDLAFCLKHLLLKCLWTPAATEGFLASFDALASAYLGGVDWEDRDAMQARTARLLPGLWLARIDGKSPVEYLVHDEDAKARVRKVASAFLHAPAARLDDILAAWRKELQA